MILREQVCSLELSKQLKELGVKQESLFYWHNISIYPQIMYGNHTEWSGDRLISAFTASELGEMLPLWFDSGKRENKDWICRVMEKNTDLNHHSFAEKEVDARAKMIIHLIENGLIENETT